MTVSQTYIQNSDTSDSVAISDHQQCKIKTVRDRESNKYYREQRNINVIYFGTTLFSQAPTSVLGTEIALRIADIDRRLFY